MTYTCESNTTTATIPNAGMPYEIAIDSDVYCSLKSNKPDSLKIRAFNDGEGDVTISPVAAISQYINKVSFVVLDSNFWLNACLSNCPNRALQ